MEAPIETTVSAPETTPDTPSVEPQTPEPQAPVTEPIPAETPSTDAAIVEKKEETPTTQTDSVPDFDEKALEGILEEIAAINPVPQKFTFKEDTKVDTPEVPNTEAVPSTAEKKE